jgi:hypothetical protein
MLPSLMVCVVTNILHEGSMSCLSLGVALHITIRHNSIIKRNKELSRPFPLYLHPQKVSLDLCHSTIYCLDTAFLRGKDYHASLAKRSSVERYL